MLKLTKSLPVIKERNCSASLVLDTRTNRKNASEYPLAIRFTVDRKFFYHPVGGSYSEKRFSDICNATKSSSNNYKEQKMWREEIVPKYKDMLVNLNKGNSLTYEWYVLPSPQETSTRRLPRKTSLSLAFGGNTSIIFSMTIMGNGILQARAISVH